jgi:hypothetical protein
MNEHWYAIGDEPWQPLFAPAGQETVVLEAVAQAMPGVEVRLAKQVNDEMLPVASCFVASAGSRDHAIVYARPITVPAGTGPVSDERSA